MAEKETRTTARDGWINLALSLALWGGLLGLFLGVGYLLGRSAGH